jgi:hypothetical protein
MGIKKLRVQDVVSPTGVPLTPDDLKRAKLALNRMAGSKSKKDPAKEGSPGNASSEPEETSHL